MSKAIDEIIKSRQTQKVLADPLKPWPAGKDVEKWEATLRELLELAASAPFHYPSHEVHRMHADLPSIFPWRMYVVRESECRALLQEFQEREIKGGKITKMLAAAKALIQVTWLPDPGAISEEEMFQGNRRNMEHIAATAAAIQNLLIGATARKIPTYWSSGGKLRLPDFAQRMGIPENEILLGALFLFPQKLKKSAEVKPGSLRGKGGELQDWSTWVIID